MSELMTERWVRRSLWVVLGLWFVVLSNLCWAQQSSAWVVKPEWVKAHEDFLASDVLAGRGSATRDEQITATYVASEFEGYGLQHPPTMDGYLQTAQITSPVLDGRAVLSAGSLKLNEGADFTLLSSPGKDASGALVRVAVNGERPSGQVRGAALLPQGVPDAVTSLQTAGMLRRLGGALILVPEDESTRMMYTMGGGRTETPVHLVDDPGSSRRPSVVALTPGSVAKLRQVAGGATVSLTVHSLPEGKIRNTFNVMGYLPGSDPHAGTILLTAHLDHLGVGRPLNGDAIFNGANDDAAGTTAVLELAHALASGTTLRRSVLFVCYGSEELGELGSTYFGEHLPVPLKDLVTNLEFEMIGNQDPKMPKNTLLLTGWDRSNLGPTLKEHGALLGPDPYPEEHFFERSDNYALALKGLVAHTAAGWGTVPTYHQPTDDLQHLDLPFMTAAIQSLVEPVRWLAMSDFVPEWNPGGRPKPR